MCNKKLCASVRGGEGKKNSRLVGATATTSLQNGAGFRRKAWTHWTSWMEKDGLNATKWAVGKGAGVKEKKKQQIYLFKLHDCENEESQGGREPHLGDKKKGQRYELEVERACSTLKEGGFQEEEEEQAKRGSLWGKGESMSWWAKAKSLHEDLDNLGFTSCGVNCGIGKKDRRRRTHS